MSQLSLWLQHHHLPFTHWPQQPPARYPRSFSCPPQVTLHSAVRTNFCIIYCWCQSPMWNPPKTFQGILTEYRAMFCLLPYITNAICSSLLFTDHALHLHLVAHLPQALLPSLGCHCSISALLGTIFPSHFSFLLFLISNVQRSKSKIWQSGCKGSL